MVGGRCVDGKLGVFLSQVTAIDCANFCILTIWTSFMSLSYSISASRTLQQVSRYEVFMRASGSFSVVKMLGGCQ